MSDSFKQQKRILVGCVPAADPPYVHLSFSHHISALMGGGPQLNKFEQVSIPGYQTSLATLHGGEGEVGLGLGVLAWWGRVGYRMTDRHD